jgi:hypothetical protein
MKSKFNFSMMAAMFAILPAATFVACDKDDDKDSGAIANNTIVAAVNNGSSYSGQIDAVKALVGADEEFDFETGTYVWTGGYEVGSTPYVNGGFTLKLQETVADKYLDPMFEDEEIPSGLTVSNPNVMENSTIILAYKADVLTGILNYRTADETWYGELLYVNGDVSTTGSFTEVDDGLTYIAKYNLHLKKGWNMAYGKYNRDDHVYEFELTTTVPAGLQWYFASYDDVGKSQQATAGASLKKRLQAFGRTR